MWRVYCCYLHIDLGWPVFESEEREKNDMTKQKIAGIVIA